jgi:hypothetical protein
LLIMFDREKRIFVSEKPHRIPAVDYTT